MKRWFVVVIAGAMLGAMGFYRSHAESKAVSTSPPPVEPAVSNPEPPARTAARSTSASPAHARIQDPPPEPGADGHAAAQLTYALYDELSEALESASPDCQLMAERMSDVVADRALELNRALAAHAARGAAAPRDVETDRNITQSIQRFNSLMTSHLPACSAQLLPVIKQLSALETPAQAAASAQASPTTTPQ